MGNLFANKTKGSTTQDTTTQNNLWGDPNLQGFLTGYNQQYSGPNISGVQSPVNAWQTGAATNQAGLATGLGTAFNAANSAASGGIDPSRISAFMSPYIQSVVDPTIAAQNQQNQANISTLRGNQATRGALGNNTGSEAAYLAGVQPAQQAAIAQLYNQGFNTAAGLTTQDIQARLAGAGAAGALTGAGTGANQSQFGMGETMRLADRQNQMDPFGLYSQGIQGYQGFGNLAGQTSHGTGTQNTTQTPGMMQSLMGLGGLGMSLFGSGGMFPLTSMFGGGGGGGYTGGGVSSWKDGGPIKGYDAGGSVLPPFQGGDDFASKVSKAFKVVQQMRASGGRTESEPESPRWASGFAQAARGIEPLETMRDYIAPIGLGAALGAAPLQRMDDRLEPLRYIPDAEANEQDMFMAPYQAEAMRLRGYDGGGTVSPDEYFARPAIPFQGFDATNTTPMGPAFAGSPVGQFMPGALGDPLQPASTGQMFGRTPETPSFSTSDLTGGTMTPFGPPPPATAPEYTSPDTPTQVADKPTGSRLEEMHPHQRFAAMLLAGSPIAQSGRALIDMHGQSQQGRIAEMQAEMQAQQLARQIAQHEADLKLRRDTLAEQTRHHQAAEDAALRSRPENAYEVARAQAAAKAANEREAAVSTSTAQLARLDEMERLLGNPNMPQGSFAGWDVAGRRAASAMFPGVDMSGIPEAEAFRGLSNQMALAVRNTANGQGMPGSMSDADREFLVQTVPRLENTRDGNRIMLRMLQDTERYRIAANNESTRYIQEHKSTDGLNQHMDAWMRQNTMAKVIPGHAEFRRQMEERARRGGEGVRSPEAANPRAPTMQVTPEALAQMPPGTRQKARDGNWYLKQADGAWLPVAPTTSTDDMTVSP